MSEKSWDVEAYMQATAGLLQVSIPPEAETGVLANLERLSEVARWVMEFPLADDCEAAPTFRP